MLLVLPKSSISQQLQGTCLVVGAACTFAILSVIVQKNSLPVPAALEVRFLIGFASATALMLFPDNSQLHWFGPAEHRHWLLLKSLIGFAFVTLWWQALQMAPVGDCIAIVYSSPTLTVLQAHVLFREDIPKCFSLRVALVTTGILLVLNPPYIKALLSKSEDENDADYSLVLLACLIGSSGPLVIRKCQTCWIEVEHLNAFCVSFVLNPLLMLLRYLFQGATPEGLPMSRADKIGLLLVIGLGSFVATAMDTKGYQLAEPGKAAMFRYLEIPFAYILQHFCTTTPVKLNAILGSMLIILSCLLGIDDKAVVETETSKDSAPLLVTELEDLEPEEAISAA